MYSYTIAAMIVDGACGNPFTGDYSKEYEESLNAQVPMSWETWTSLKQKIMRVSQMKREEFQRTRDPEFLIVMD